MSDDNDNIGPTKPETIAAQGLGWTDPVTGAVVPPLHPSSTYERDTANRLVSGRLYSRADNPNYDQPQAVLAALEKGADAMLFASGNAAGSSVFLALKAGDHVVGPRVMYWALRNWITGFARDWGLEIDFVDMRDPDAIRAAIRPGKTKLVWCENPANPSWDVTDIAAAAKIAHEAGAKLVVDSTAATPVFSRPIEHGADIVMHSATKYLNGHSDVIAGALVTKAKDEFWERIRMVRVQQGAVLGPFEAWLLMRGMRTLFPRVKAAAANAMAIAQHFEKHPRVEEVLYPGLKSFAGHAVAAKQMSGGFGGMLSIRTKGGGEGALRTIAHVKVWKRATSLGGVESLIEHRASVEGANSPVAPDLLRLSTGIEDVSDLIGDLEQSLGSNS